MPLPPAATPEPMVAPSHDDGKHPTKKTHSRSLLRYPGGKTRAVKGILSLIPTGVRTLCSPFLGGASLELACSARGIQVFGYDVFQPLVNFWTCALSQPKNLAAQVQQHHPLAKKRFYQLQKDYFMARGNLERAALFYTLNRSSFSGTTLSGGMSPGHPRFTLSSIRRLATFSAPNLQVEHMDFSESIPRHQKTFLYLDPPYLNGQKLYGVKGNTHEGFDHEALKSLLRKREGWVLSYNDCSTIREWYADYQILKLDWTYGMSGNKQSKEVVILSRDVKPPK